MDKQLAKHPQSPIYQMATKFSIDPNKLIEVLRGTVIKPSKGGHAATNEEVAAFIIVANQYGLSPFTREIHAFTSGEKGVVPIVGIDGWTHIVNTRGDFDGCEFEEVAADDGTPDRITCRMYVKERQHPVCATERYKECKRNTIPWQTMPWRMLRHKAYMQAARYAFGLSGIFDEDEARDIVNVTPLREPVAMPKAIEEPKEPLSPPHEESEPPADSATPPPEVEQPKAPAPTAEIPEGCEVTEGKILRVVQKDGVNKTTKKPWKKWDVEFEDNSKASTFDEKLAMEADKAAADGWPVKAYWIAEGAYRTLKAIVVA